MKFFTVGPTQHYPTVTKHLQTAIDQDILPLSHRSAKFSKLYSDLRDNLHSFLQIPQEYKIYFYSSSTEIWERITQNCITTHSEHYVSGAFGKRFGEIVQELGKKSIIHTTPDFAGIDLSKINISSESNLLAFTHNESACGTQINLNDLYEIKNKYPHKLIALDCVSSLPGNFVDISKVDLCYFSVQKGFGLPPGLAVLVVSPAAFGAYEGLRGAGVSTGSYRSFYYMEKFGAKNQTHETPNTLAMFLLNQVLLDMQKVGRQKIITDTDIKFEMLYRALQQNSNFELAVKDSRYWSKTVVTAYVKNGSANFISYLNKDGFDVAPGYGDRGPAMVRIGNFPSHSVEDTQKLCELIVNYKT